MKITDTPVLWRMLRPVVDCLSAASLRSVIAVKPNADEVARYHELADKNTEGSLTPEEISELEDMVSANMLLSIFSKVARATLASRAA